MKTFDLSPRPWFARLPRKSLLKGAVSVLTMLLVIGWVDGFGTFNGMMNATIAEQGPSLFLDATRMAQCKQEANTVVGQLNPNGARMAMGLTLPQNAAERLDEQRFQRDVGLRSSSCMNEHGGSLMANMISAGSLSVTFMPVEGLPALSSSDQALQAELLRSLTVSTNALFEHRSTQKIAVMHQIDTMCSGVLNQVRCLPWRVFAGLNDSSWASFKRPSLIMNSFESPIQQAVKTDVWIDLMNHPSVLADLQKDPSTTAKQRGALYDRAYQKRAAQYDTLSHMSELYASVSP